MSDHGFDFGGYHFEMDRGFLNVWRGTGRGRELVLNLDPSDVADLRELLEGK
jgi:hypothetical protein